MTYNVGQTAAAADYVGFRGTNGPNVAYANFLSALNKSAAIIGVGYGNVGYGQTGTSFNTVTTGNVIAAAEWNRLFSVLGNINIHTGSNVTIPNNVSTGDTIIALDGSSGRANLTILTSTLNNARMAAAIGQMSLSSALTSTRSTQWNTSVYHEFTATFSSENEARYFFNSGGQIYAAGSRTGGTTTPLNSGISAMLTEMGTIKLGAESTTYTGTGGTAYAIGYYGLTGTYQNVFYHPGSVSYSAPNYTLKARVENVAGVNAGNGTLIRFQALFETGLPSGDISDGTLVSTISQLKAGGVLTITAPTYATTSALYLQIQ